MSNEERLLILTKAILEMEYHSKVSLLHEDTVKELENLEWDLISDIN